MVICTVEVNEKAPQTIVIGRRGTYNTQEVVFDIGYLIDAYGAGTAVLAVKRSQDSSAYPAVVAQEDSTVTWTVSETDTYYKGAGECELMWYVDGGLAKTIIYPMVVMRDILSTTEEAPDAYQTWVDDLTALGAETLQNAQDAAQSASDAESAKDDAVDAKEAAEEAAEKAEEASIHAPIIQGGYWYIWNNGQYVNTGVRAEGQKGDQGDPGEKGDTGNGIASIVKTGTSGLVDTYTVTYTDGTTTTFTVTNGAKGDKGDTGATGNGIQSITKTGTSGNVDTYTITYTNGQTTTFTVTNGAVSSVAGKTGAVTLNANDVAFHESGTYDDGTVGKELSHQKNALTFIGNLFDSATATTGKSFNSSGAIVDLELAFITDYIPVQPGIKVSTNMSLQSSYYYHVIYDSSKSIIDKYKSNNDNKIMTMPPNAAFIRLTGAAANISTAYVNFETAKFVSSIGGEVTDIGNRLESAEDSIQNLNFEINGIYNNDLNEYFYRGEPAGTRYTTVYFSPAIPAGTYSFSCSSVDSTDTQHTVSRVIFYNGSTTLETKDVSRSQGINTKVVLSAPCDAINFYGATNWSDSGGVTFTFNNVRIYNASQLENRLSENELIVDTSAMNNLNNTNIFRFGKYFSHLGVDKTSNIIIPSQSLADVGRAKRLGFKAIELNVRLTSDNKFICIHGSSGNFGYQFEGLNGEDVHATAINSMTLSEIKSGIRFKSIYSKYKTAPFSLTEMLRECKRQNIIPVVEYQPTYPQYGFFDILDSVMGKNNYIVNLYNLNRDNVTNSPCVSWLSITDPAVLVAKCKASGGSYCASLNVTNADYSSFTKSDWESLSDAVHAEGYLIGFAEYAPVATSLLLESCGFDIIASLHSINDFDCGNICNLDGGANFSDFNTTGTVSNANLVLVAGDTVTPQNQLESIFLGGGILRIRFSGSITLSFGQMITNVALSSDGANEITISTFFEEETPDFEISATSGTTIYELSYKASKM